MASSCDKSKAFIKLNGKNYTIWKYQTSITLRHKRLFDYVDGTADPPEEPDETATSKEIKKYEKELAVYECQDTAAQEIIVARLEENPVRHILSCKTAREIWSKLEAIYEQKSDIAIDLLHSKYQNYKYQKGSSMASYLAGLQEIKAKLIECGEEVSDRNYMTRLIDGLPREYAHFRSSWDSTYNKTVNELEARLFIEELRLKEDNKRDSADSSNALVGKSFYHKNKNKTFQKNESGNKSGSNDSKICNFCKRKGHVGNDCEFKKDYDSGVCFKCHKKGHMSKSCPDNKPKEENVNQKKPKSREKETSDGLIVTAFVDDNKGTLSHDSWYLDSAASEHMINTNEYYCEYEMFDEPVNVRVGDGKFIPGYGVGDIKVELFDGTDWVQKTFLGVLYVPELACNLFSIGAATAKGCSFEFIENDCFIKKNNEIIGTGKKVNKLYELSVKLMISNERCEEAFLSTYDKKVKNIKQWHENLCHQNVGHVRKILKSHEIEFEDIPDFFCESCIFGKQHMLPFESSSTVAIGAGDLIHADVCGPMQVDSTKGSKYFLLLRDDYSHFRKVYFLKQKSEAKSKIVEYLKLIETQFNRKPKILRTDNGLEEVNKEVSDFITDNGMIHQRSCARTAQQNGRIERDNRTVVESARTMLVAAKLKKIFWAEAVNTAVYVLNLTGTSSVSGKTPYELWYGEKPNLSNLKVFGTTAYIFVPKELRRKWDNRSKKGIFVGYGETEGVKGFRVYVPETRKFETSRNVIFHGQLETSAEDYEKDDFEFFIDREDLTESKVSDENLFEDNDSENLIKGNDSESLIESNDPILNEDNENENRSLIEENDSEIVNEIHSVGNLQDDLESEGESSPMPYQLRDKRNLKAPAKYKDYVTAMVCDLNADEVLTYEKVMSGPEFRKWQVAIDKEFQSLNDHNTWIGVPTPKGKKILQTKWVLRIKSDVNGEPEYKARVVVRGFQQGGNFYSWEIYAPVAKLTTVRILLALAVYYQMEIHQMDVKGAFLNGKLNDEVYVYPPEGLDIGKDRVLKLNKSLYGLKRAPRCWNDKFNNFMRQNDFSRSLSDSCLYFKIDKNVKVFVLLYVDDLMILGNDTNAVKEFKQKLNDTFKMKDLGKISNYLGLHIVQKSDSIEIDQKEYLEKVLSKIDLTDCKEYDTPLDPNFKISETIDLSFENTCRKLIGYLMYAMVGSRPDICVALNILSRYQNKANGDLLKALKRVFSYIKKTIDLKLIYKRNTKCPVIQGYADASFGDDLVDRKSTTGYLFKVFNCNVLWRSKKQGCVANSSTEAEYVSLAEATADGLWIRNLLLEIEISGVRKIIIHEDNMPAMFIAMSTESGSRLKHIDLKFHFIKEKIEKGYVQLKYIQSSEQIADVLTKALRPVLFVRHRLALGFSS